MGEIMIDPEASLVGVFVAADVISIEVFLLVQRVFSSNIFVMNWAIVQLLSDGFHLQD